MSPSAGSPAPRAARRRRDSGRAPRVEFGGTFDPPHFGISPPPNGLVIGSGRPVVSCPPERRPQTVRARSTVRARLAMTRLAVRGQAGFVAPISKPAVTARVHRRYLRTLAMREPHSKWYLIVGEDNLEISTRAEPEATSIWRPSSSRCGRGRP